MYRFTVRIQNPYEDFEEFVCDRETRREALIAAEDARPGFDSYKIVVTEELPPAPNPRKYPVPGEIIEVDGFQIRVTYVDSDGRVEGTWLFDNTPTYRPTDEEIHRALRVPEIDELDGRFRYRGRLFKIESYTHGWDRHTMTAGQVK